MTDRADPGSNPAQVSVRLPDGQCLRAALRARHQEADGSWWALVLVTLIVRYVQPDGRLTAEPEPVSFWAPMADGVVTPIEGENYQDVPTTRHQELLRGRARQQRVGRSPRGGGAGMWDAP